ncbi:unnamed protein product [Arctia plantaginis]|uniref:Citrate transporter-like domain-containing protein n=1 Tax=Arctia plantaginis TaxID=874455 RepID=A0A8S0YWD3_ARCPL|nr:unnamed protein product [Arctia plantaginis]
MAKAKKRVKVVNDNITVPEIVKCFISVHWRGVLTTVTPLIFLFVILPLPAEPYCWVAYTLLIMAVFWMTECIPIAVTGFLPVVIFSLSGVMSTRNVCRCYMNDTIIMFLGSLFLANCIEQSGVHKRLVYFAVRIIGYSHFKLLFAMCSVTTFVSMWISNTAATTMMVPINFALLKVFEEEKVLKMYDTTPDGDLVASDMTTCYFCAATYSATIGGIGTLVGTGTNLVFKGLFTTEYPKEPDYLSFPLFSAFAVPYMIVMEAFMYLYLITLYFGAFRPDSPEAKSSKITPAAKEAAKKNRGKKCQGTGAN